MCVCVQACGQLIGSSAKPEPRSDSSPGEVDAPMRSPAMDGARTSYWGGDDSGDGMSRMRLRPDDAAAAREPGHPLLGSSPVSTRRAPAARELAADPERGAILLAEAVKVLLQGDRAITHREGVRAAEAAKRH